METHVHKWGNSIGLRIPSKLARSLNLHPGSAVKIGLKNNHIEITPKKYNLSEIIKMINRDNLHTEFFQTNPLGNEVW